MIGQQQIRVAVAQRYDFSDYDSFGTAKDNCANQDFIKPGFRIGSVGSRIAMPGTGKTWFSIQEAIAIATGGLFCGYHYKRGGVVYLSAKEPRDEIRSRCQTLYEGLELAPDAMQMVNNNLKFWHLFGQAPDLLESADGVFLFEEGLKKFINRHQPFHENDQLKLIVFDTLRHFSHVNENSASEMRSVLTRVESIARKFGCACMCLHHVNKSSATKDDASSQQIDRGSSVLFDHIKYQEYLQPMHEDVAKQYGVTDRGSFATNKIGNKYQNYIEWGVSKSNSRETIKPIWLERQDDGILKPCKIGKYSPNAAKMKVF